MYVLWILEVGRRFVFILFGTYISRKANQQSVVILSITQAKYIALVKGVKKVMWMKCMIGELLKNI